MSTLNDVYEELAGVILDIEMFGVADPKFSQEFLRRLAELGSVICFELDYDPKQTSRLSREAELPQRSAEMFAELKDWLAEQLPKQGGQE